MIETVGDDGTFIVKYSDGDVESAVPKSRISTPVRLKPYAGKLGEKVMAKYQNRYWHPAEIIGLNEDGTCDVIYVRDRVAEMSLGAARLKPMPVDSDALFKKDHGHEIRHKIG